MHQNPIMNPILDPSPDVVCIDDNDLTEIEGEVFSTSALSNKNCYSLDASVLMFAFLTMLQYLPTAKNLSGTVRVHDAVGDYPILGEVIYDPENDTISFPNTFSVNVVI